MTSTILAALGAAVLILHTATRLPVALADLLRACLPLAHALRDLRAAFTARDNSCTPPPSVPDARPAPAPGDLPEGRG
ncbi:hypothetical protein [Nonomuraea sp. 10N515B]|uniref:hypothetical protein n=1 Tax=Nonomuraea sp. 10N515B TaxID=3457422 RepID=UPI003FCD78A3